MESEHGRWRKAIIGSLTRGWSCRPHLSNDQRKENRAVAIDSFLKCCDAPGCTSRKAHDARASIRSRHFAQMRGLVGIETASACHRFDGAIGRDEHENWITNRMTVADPGQR